MVKVFIPTLACLRCGYRWMPRQPDVRICPRCKSKHWETRRRTRQGLRTDLMKKGAKKR